MKRSMIDVTRWIVAAAAAGAMAGCFGQTSGICGNGFLEGDEYCDDGNLEDGDSCPRACNVPIDAGPMVNPDPDEPDAGDDDGGPVGTVNVVINEFVFNHANTDQSEFIEIHGKPDWDYSHLTFVVIEGDAGSSVGVIDAAIAIGKTNAGGFFKTDFMGNRLENDTQTLLLVDGFTGAQGLDLDSDDDGQLDSPPWTKVVDAVAVVGFAGGRVYAGAPALPRTLPVLDPGEDTVGGASRVPDGGDTDQVADWHRNDYDGSGLPCCTAAVGLAGEALNTPGLPNAVIP